MDFGKLFNKLVDVVKENIETAAKQTTQTTSQPKPTPQPAATPHYEEEIYRTDSEWMAYFREILATEFAAYNVRENVAVTEVAGFANDEFQLYKTRPRQAYKAEWGQPYTFVYLVRNPTLTPQLEKTHHTPLSSRDEGLLFLHGLERNPESSFQTPQEA